MPCAGSVSAVSTLKILQFKVEDAKSHRGKKFYSVQQGSEEAQQVFTDEVTVEISLKI